MLDEDTVGPRQSPGIEWPPARPSEKRLTRLDITIDASGKDRAHARQLRDLDSTTQQMVGAAPVPPVWALQRQKTPPDPVHMVASDAEEFHALNGTALSGREPL